MAARCKAHALIFPFPLTLGHINPMMELALKLASKGMLVTFVNILSHHTRIVSKYEKANNNVILHPQQEAKEQQQDKEDGFQLFSSGLPPNLRLVGVSDGLPFDFEREKNLETSHDAIKDTNGVLALLLLHLQRQGEAVTCFIADSFLPWTETVAHDVAIPWVSVWTQSTNVFSIYSYTFLASNEDKEVPPSEVLALMNSVYDAPPMAIADLPTFVQVEDPTEFIICILRDVFHGFLKADYIMGTSFYSLEPIAQDFITSTMHLPIHAVGPLLPQSNFEHGMSKVLRVSKMEEELHCLQWLDKHALESVIFVSFGSMAPLSKEQTQEIAHGLEASGIPFLWVIRGLGDTCQDLPIGFIERVSSRGLLISWAPQLQVLAHPSIGGFLTHCGWSSCIESITHGVPMLGLPYFSDQPTNCKLIADHWKVGLPIHKEMIDNGEFPSRYRIVPGVASREEVEHKVRILMLEKEGKEMRRRAKYLSKEARAAIAPDGTSEKALQAFVFEMEKLAESALPHKVIP